MTDAVKPPAASAAELPDAALDAVTGGFLSFIKLPPTKPAPTTGGGTTGGVEGESTDDKHKGE